MKIRGNTVGTPMSVSVVMDDSKVCDKAWSSKKIIDRFCPSFTESGSVISCEPVEGYPLNAVSTLPVSDTGYTNITFEQLGKNLYNEDEYPLRKGHYVKQSIYRADLCACVEKFIPVSHLRGLKITISHVAPLNQPGLYFYTAADGNTVIQPSTQAGWKGPTFTVPDNASYMRFAVPNECADTRCIQIELGEVSTDYEAYKAQDVKNVEFPQTVFGGTFNWNTGELVSTQGGVKFSELDWHYDEVFAYFYADLPSNVDESAEMSCTGFEYRPGAYDDIVAGGSESDVFDVRDGRIVVYNPGNDNLADFIDYKASEDFDCILWYSMVEPSRYDLEPFDIVGKEGVNTIITSPVVTTVSGKEDLLAIIEKLRAKE